MLGLDLLLGSVGGGDMVGAEGGIERSTWVGVGYEWGKFGEPSTILKSRNSSIGIIYDIFREYVQSVVVGGCGTCPMRTENGESLKTSGVQS